MVRFADVAYYVCHVERPRNMTPKLNNKFKKSPDCNTKICFLIVTLLSRSSYKSCMYILEPLLAAMWIQSWRKFDRFIDFDMYASREMVRPSRLVIAPDVRMLQEFSNIHRIDREFWFVRGCDHKCDTSTFTDPKYRVSRLGCQKRERETSDRLPFFRRLFNVDWDHF